MTKPTAMEIPLQLASIDKPTRLDLAATEVWMLWPDDPTWRQRAFEAALAEHVRQTPTLLAGLDKETVVPIFADALPIWAIYDEVRRGKFIRGMIAGRVLHQAIVGSLNKNEKVTMEACIEFAIKPFKKDKNGGFARLSVKTFNNDIWKQYRSVAHFWAANAKALLIDKQKSFPCELRCFRKFLEDAEAYRLIGEVKKINPHAPNTILRPGEAILVPARLKVRPSNPLQIVT